MKKYVLALDEGTTSARAILFDREAHITHTGLDNRTVKENILSLDGTGKRFIVRTPLIPGATDSDKNIGDIAEFLGELNNLDRWELLNFNPLGGSKYSGLDIEDPYMGVSPLSDERCGELLTIAKERVKNVKVI